MLESEITICNSFIQNRLDEGTDQKSICPLSFLDKLTHYVAGVTTRLCSKTPSQKSRTWRRRWLTSGRTGTTIFSVTNHIQNLISADTGSETSALGSRTVGSAMAVAQILPCRHQHQLVLLCLLPMPTT